MCNGWSSDCAGSRDGDLVCLINLVCLETTQTELEGMQGTEGLCSREGTDSLCWVHVGVLEARLVLV